MNNILASRGFPAWRSVTMAPAAGIWAQVANWNNGRFLGQLLNLLEDELAARFGLPPEEVTAFGAAVLQDLVDDPPTVIAPLFDVQRDFLRFFLATKLVEYCQRYGRTSLAFDWLLCALSDRPWTHVEAGQPQEVVWDAARLSQFMMSTAAEVRVNAPLTVVSFIHSLYYYSWTSGGHRELAAALLDDARLHVRTAMQNDDSKIVIIGVEAASALATWCLQNEHRSASDVVRDMVGLYSRSGAPEEARKLVATTLATSVAARIGQSSVEWAKRALTQHGALLIQHEPVQIMIASCTTPEEMAEKYDEVMAAVECYTSSCDNQRSGDAIEIAFRRIQLFGVFAPFIVGLVSIGHCAEAVNATAAWFSVPVERRRKSAVLAILAGIKDVVIYAVDDRAIPISHDSSTATIRLAKALNDAFDMNIVVRDDHTFPPRPQSGRRCERKSSLDELAEATAAYYELALAADEIKKTEGLSLFQPHTVPAPLVPLVHSRLGVAWPIVTSFEEPETDRPVQRALIWSYGSYTSAHEARAVAAILEAANVECEVMADKELSREEFLRFYTDSSFDLVWVSAHGMFDPTEPHQAHIEISNDHSEAMLLSELIRHPVVGHGRRLLFLNICLGASVAVTEAPPRLGLAAMLASAKQAVVSHMVEVRSDVALVFGVCAAIPLARGESFISAFNHALDAVRLDQHAAVELVAGAAPQCEELIGWLRNRIDWIELDDIRTWGTGVFYE